MKGHEWLVINFIFTLRRLHLCAAVLNSERTRIYRNFIARCIGGFP